MKVYVYGIKIKTKSLVNAPRIDDAGHNTAPNAVDGFVSFVAGDGRALLTLPWYCIPRMQPLFYGAARKAWWDTRDPLGDPMEYDVARGDHWIASDVVEALYLRTARDLDEYVCPTLHRPKT